MTDSDVGFDVNAFLSTGIAEPLATTRPQVPEGRWLMRVAELDSGSDVSAWLKPPEGNAKSPRLDVPFVVVDETVMREMGRSQPPTMTQGYWINLRGGNLLDPKNNAELGQLFAALGIETSTPGEMFSKLPGAGPLYGTVTADRKPDKGGVFRHRVTKTEKAT